VIDQKDVQSQKAPPSRVHNEDEDDTKKTTTNNDDHGLFLR
jgi:hypothetical protein